MSIRDLSFLDPRLSRRLLLGAFIGATGGLGAALPDGLRALTGPRFQVVRGTEYDVWVSAVGLAGAALLAGVAGSALGPLWRRRPVAALLAALCMVPLATAQTVAANPRGPTPYRPDWAMVLMLAALVGAIVGWQHPAFARSMAAAHRAQAERRAARRQRPAA